MGARRKRNPVLVQFQGVALRQEESEVFKDTNWTWRQGEQWAVLSPNDPGKALFLEAFVGKAPVSAGAISWEIPRPSKGSHESDTGPEESIALVSAHTQRELILRESSFYQSRWQSGIGEGERTVAEYLSQDSVENINPYEVNPPKSDSKRFLDKQKRILQAVGIGELYDRNIIQLSNGEQRKVLLAGALLRDPGLLVFDNPFDGLDPAMRERFEGILTWLARRKTPFLLATSRPDEIPGCVTHVLLLQDFHIIAQGTREQMLQHPFAKQLAREAAIKRGKSRLKADAVKPIQKQFRATKVSVHPGRKGAAAAKEEAPLVEFRHVTIRAGKKRILDDVSWTIKRNENWALLGHNGAGKTTLLSLIQCDHPQAYAQDIRIFGKRYDESHAYRMIRNRISGFSPELHQHYPGDWTCLETVGSGFYDSIGLYEPLSRRQRSSSLSWLETFGLKSAADEPLSTLPLGDQRLVLLARAMVKKPELLILDEPCQGLDAAHRAAVLEAVDRVMERARASLIITTHHPKELPRCVTHILSLKSGRVVQSSQLVQTPR